VLKCKAALVKTKLENIRASVLQRKLCERLADVVSMLFAQPIKAGLDLVDAARAISCKDILEWGYVYLLSAKYYSRPLYGITYLLRGLSSGTSIEPNIRINQSQEDPNLFPSSHPPCARPLGNGRKDGGYIPAP
jgi:hypothetical protein